VNSRHNDVVTSDGYSTSYRKIMKIMASVFLKQEKICYKMVYYSLYFS